MVLDNKTAVWEESNAVAAGGSGDGTSEGQTEDVGMQELAQEMGDGHGGGGDVTSWSAMPVPGPHKTSTSFMWPTSPLFAMVGPRK